MPTLQLLKHIEVNHTLLQLGETRLLVVIRGKNTQQQQGCASRLEASAWTRPKFDGESKALIVFCVEVQYLLPRRSLLVDMSRPLPQSGLIMHLMPPLWRATQPHQLDEDHTTCRSDLAGSHPPLLLDEVQERRMPKTIARLK